MRIYLLALAWAASILLLALSARLGWVEREAAELLLLVLPMIAFVTLLGGHNCRPTVREA